MKNYLFFFLFSFFGLFGKEPPLRVGMELNYPPFEMICHDGKPCGISVDIAQALGRFLKREIVIENIAFVGLIPALKTAKVDLIISSLTATEQRRKAIDFSEPYGKIGLCLLISAKSNLQDIQGANESDRVIVVKSGTTGEMYALQNLKGATIRILDKEAMCVLEVIQGKADAFIYDQLSVYTQWQKNPLTTRAQLKPFQLEDWAVGIQKGNRKLLDQVNLFIADFKQSGGFERLGDSYLPEQKAAFNKLGVPFVF
jgi:polar amino acid transport system substrate-binding protein